MADGSDWTAMPGGPRWLCLGAAIGEDDSFSHGFSWVVFLSYSSMLFNALQIVTVEERLQSGS